MIADNQRRRRPPGRSRARSRLSANLAVLTALLLPVAGSAQNDTGQPTLNLFPSQTVDSIRETSRSARELERNLQSVLGDLDKQMQLYRESGCEGAVQDAGCQEINRQMASTYRRMLDFMAEQLPQMRHNVEVTRKTLEKRLAEELGYGRTGAELQQLLRRGDAGTVLQGRTRPMEGGLRLSDRFRQYYRLVSQGGGGAPSALVGARIYLDLEQTSQLIELTQQEIQRGRMLANLSESFGQVTPQMEETVSGVKTVIFGETAAGASAPGSAPQSPAQGAGQAGGFCSEFDPNC